MQEDVYQRTQILLGSESVNRIKKSSVAIFGIGGVGSFTLEALARVGVGKIYIFDKDTIDITNINRQIIALETNIGEDKVHVATNRVKDINSKISIVAKKICVNNENIDEVFNELHENDVTYVVDCVDDVEAKLDIIIKSKKFEMDVISCMGMGNKLNPLDIRVEDIHSTKTCPLAKIIRKRLREDGIYNVKTVYSIEEPKKKTDIEKELYGNTLGSVSFVPSVAGLVIASEVVKYLIKGDN